MSHPTADEEISKYQRSDLSLKKWDLRLKAATFFTAALLAVIAWCDYANRDEESRKLREKEIEQREQEFTLRFYDRQVEAYAELCEVIGRLGQKKQLLSGDADYQRFMELYYGKTLLFADKEVFDKLNDFHRLLYGMMHKTTEFDKFGIKAVGGKAVMACHRSVRRKFPKLGPELGTETMENVWAIPDDDEKDGNEPVKIGELPFEKISIPELLKNPAQYDKKKVAFSGIVRTWTQVHKDGVYSVHIAVEGGGKTIDLHSASNEGVYVTKGTRVEVKGIFYRELERGALKATNTVDASPAYGGGIVKAK